MQDTKHFRVVRSFVLREGRLTKGQAQALTDHWHTFGIDYSPSQLELDDVFNRTAPRILDIGSGMGDSTLELANKHPENDYWAIEVHRPGVGSLIRKAIENNLRNIKVSCHDVVEILHHQIPNNSIDEVYIWFSDPWPKKKHHKRRLVSSTFLTLLKPKLKSHARLYLATDWQELAEYLLEVCDNHAEYKNLARAGHFAPRPVWRPLTKFEKRGERHQHGVWDLIYCLR